MFRMQQLHSRSRGRHRTQRGRSLGLVPAAALALTLALGGIQACAAPGDPVADGDEAGGRLVVSGQAEVRAAPDRARFTVGVRNDGREAQQVLDENARRTAALIAALREGGVEARSLRTQGVSLQPQWAQPPRDRSGDWTPKVVGYQASNRIEVRTEELARVGALLAIAATAGANDIEGVSFSLEDDRSARTEAIEAATRRALDEARVLATAAGVRTGTVLELRLDHASTSMPMPKAAMQRGMMMAEASDMGAVPVEPGEVTITASVTITLALQQ